MSSNTRIQLAPALALGIMLGMISVPASAETADATRTSKSISFVGSTELDQAAKDDLLNQAEVDVMAPLNKQGYRPESGPVALQINTTRAHPAGDFTLYDASTDLISDFDHDGFYHRFSVAIDADTIYDTAYVYVKLYLSYEGGPWNYYAASDNYHIHADSVSDTYIVETELADGYEPGYYDVRIELYDADHDSYLLSYGPYDDASLSALPLEDSYHDDGYDTVYYPVETEIVVTGHGHGSMSWGLLLVPGVLAAVRRFNKWGLN
ncbi:MAG: choice-of-anchor H family protein [Gammaproteobacteria bacterium]